MSMVTKEIQWNGLTVTVQGKAESWLSVIGGYDYPNEYETEWVQEPEIIDVHNNYYDVTLTPEEEKEILDSLDINDFVC